MGFLYMECRLFQKGAKNWAANYLGHAGKRHLFSAREVNAALTRAKGIFFSAREIQHSAHVRKKVAQQRPRPFFFIATKFKGHCIV